MASKPVLNTRIQELEKQVEDLKAQLTHSDAVHVRKDAELLRMKQMLLDIEKQQLGDMAMQVEGNLRALMKPEDGARFNFITGTFDAPAKPANPVPQLVKRSRKP
jgi:hypothetical protein